MSLFLANILKHINVKRTHVASNQGRHLYSRKINDIRFIPKATHCIHFILHLHLYTHTHIYIECTNVYHCKPFLFFLNAITYLITIIKTVWVVLVRVYPKYDSIISHCCLQIYIWWLIVGNTKLFVRSLALVFTPIQSPRGQHLRQHCKIEILSALLIFKTNYLRLKDHDDWHFSDSTAWSLW